MLKKILVAVDGSDESQRAARFAGDLAVHFGAALALVHVIPPLLVPPDAYGFDVGAMMAEQERAAEKMLRSMETRLEEPGLRVERLYAHGPPAETVAELAKKGAYDLVVVGSRGRNAAARVLLGSVSDRLVHILDCPVAVIR